jgi:predicted O-methyltransferase YrrM
MGFVEDGLLVFESRKQGDYHEDMNAQVFENWFQNILEKLEDGAVIVMDNASYHSRLAEKTPVSSWKKAQIKEWLH